LSHATSIQISVIQLSARLLSGPDQNSVRVRAGFQFANHQRDGRL